MSSKRSTKKFRLTIEIFGAKHAAQVFRIPGLSPAAKELLLRSLCEPEADPQFAYNILRNTRLYETLPHSRDMKQLLGEKLLSTGEMKYLGQLLLSFKPGDEIRASAITSLTADPKRALRALRWLKIREILPLTPKKEVERLASEVLKSPRLAWAAEVFVLLVTSGNANFCTTMRFKALRRLMRGKGGAGKAFYILADTEHSGMTLTSAERALVIRAIAQHGEWSFYILNRDWKQGKGLLTADMDFLIPSAVRYATRPGREHEARRLLSLPTKVFLSQQQRKQLEKVVQRQAK